MLEKDEKQEEVHVDDRRDSKADAAAEIQKLYSQMRAGRKKSGSITSIGSPAGVLKLEKPPAIPEGTCRYCKKCPSTCTCITCTQMKPYMYVSCMYKSKICVSVFVVEEFFQTNIDMLKEQGGLEKLLLFCVNLPVFAEIASKKKEFFSDENTLTNKYVESHVYMYNDS